MTRPHIDDEEWRSAVTDLSEFEWAEYEDPQTYNDTH